MTTLLPQIWDKIQYIKEKTFGNKKADRIFIDEAASISDETYLRLSQAIQPYHDQKSLYEIVMEDLGNKPFNPFLEAAQVASSPDRFMVGVDPSFNISVGFKLASSVCSADSYIQVQYEDRPQFSNCNKPFCPAAKQLEEFTSLRNKRFVSDSSDPYFTICDNIVDEFMDVNKMWPNDDSLTHEDKQKIYKKRMFLRYNLILKFQNFDFPITLSNNEMIFL